MERLGRFISGMCGMLLMVAAFQAQAASQVGGRDFNHMTTGFPLSGGHAAAACETCHVGGVFKGTPRNCDGCHAVGRRVVATPKNDKHIVTDAPCESCHFNTATWLGVRYNHGSAVVGQCRTCHNGRQAEGKAGSHSTGKKATESCDSCHRTFAWTPASWNHNLSPGVCSTCHTNAATVSSANLKPVGHAAPALKGTEACDACHSYLGWYPNRFKHNIAGTCSSCHLNAAKAVGQPASHSSFTGWPMECNECHTSTTAWLPALGAKPANHIPYNAGVACSSCHVGGSVLRGASMHAFVSTYACTTCHLKNNAYTGWGQDTKSYGHEGWSTGDCSQSGCHAPLGRKGTAYINWD